jgi:hypothetical protein
MALGGLFCGLATDDDVAGDGLSGEGGKVDHLLPEVRSQMSIVLSARDELFTLPTPGTPSGWKGIGMILLGRRCIM